MRGALLVCLLGGLALSCGGDCEPVVELEYRETCSQADPCVAPYLCVELSASDARCLLPCAEDNCPCGFSCTEMSTLAGPKNYCARDP